MQTTLTSKGQTTVPAKFRRKLGLRPGSRVEWREERGRVVLLPVEEAAPSPAIDRLRGLLKHRTRDSDAWLKKVRGK